MKEKLTVKYDSISRRNSSDDDEFALEQQNRVISQQNHIFSLFTRESRRVFRRLFLPH
jgi:hypothetical protein